MKKYGIVALLVVGMSLGTITCLYADDAPGDWDVGYWNQSCGAYLADANAPDVRDSNSVAFLKNEMAKSWVEWYLTAIALMARFPGREQGWTLKKIDFPALTAWLSLTEIPVPPRPTRREFSRQRDQEETFDDEIPF
jgi:hypothetical protein